MTEDLPRLPLAHVPTPVQFLPRFTSHLGGPEIWLKRDDLTGGTGLGGNKVRKLEFLLAEAQRSGASVVLTTGGPQSNHARATAAACARAGLRCVLVLAGKDPGARQGNLLLNALFGAEVRFPGAFTAPEQAEALEAAASDLRRNGETPYIIPGGGSNPLGTCGSYESYRELREQLPDCAWIACATGTGGTHAGLVLGKLLHGDRTGIVGLSVWLPARQVARRTAELVTAAAALMGASVADPSPHIRVEDAFHPRYGRASREGLEMLQALARLEGVALDHIYTAKAMAGLVRLIRAGEISKSDRVVFLHTGGTPALFAGQLPL